MIYVEPDLYRPVAAAGKSPAGLPAPAGPARPHPRDAAAQEGGAACVPDPARRSAARHAVGPERLQRAAGL